MKLWKHVLTGSVLTAMVLVPKKGHLAEPAQARLKSSDSALASIPLNMPARVPANLPARSPISVATSAQKPLRGIRIVVDPGHGGQAQYSKIRYTGGTVGVATGQTESDVNLRVSVMLKTYLEAAGAEVLMTRISDDRCTGADGDKSAELDFRSNFANCNGADLFISVHHNDAGKSQSNYSAVFYPSGTVHSISLAENIAQSLHNHMGVQTVGAKSGSYRVLDRIKMPGVIVEASFMTNYEEDRRLANVAYNKLEAKSIATGIINYIRLTKGRQVDFNSIYAPIDDQAGSSQAVADASFVRRDIVEKKSLFGTTYEEVTYDAYGRVASRRELGSTRATAKADSSRKSTSSKKASVQKTSRKKSTTSSAKKSTSKARKVTASATSKKSKRTSR